MRKSILYALLAFFVVAGPAWAQDELLVSESFENEDLVQVLDKISLRMGGLTIVGPGVTGTVTLALEKVPIEEAVARVLESQNAGFDFKIIRLPEPTLVVTKKGELEKLCQDLLKRRIVKLEFLLEEAPAAAVVDFLRAEYPKVRFTYHPTMNGFYAQGGEKELLQIKRELSNLDRVPEPPQPAMREFLPAGRSGLTASNEVYYSATQSPVKLETLLQSNQIAEQTPGDNPPAESYDEREETKFRDVTSEPLSTFSIDVDTASYANVRRLLNEGVLPPAGAVRIEEMINYFTYNYPQPQGKVPFSVSTELSECPWSAEHQLLRIGLQGRHPQKTQMPPRNLVFLIDVSGSMQDQNKLPLVKRSLRLLLSTLGKADHVAIVVYAGSEGLYLPATTCDQKALISEKIESLGAAGSTNGAAGIQLAYQVARENFQKDAVNRVILCTDGDFNVGLTGGSLTSLIEKEREDGTFLSVLGFGTGNIKDDTLEGLADKGNGNYAYIDGLSEAEKVLVKEAGATLETIAKDVKLQLEFNPKRVHSYRLIGYENRRLQNEDFDDDKKDAGEMGAGHNVTALYELVLDGEGESKPLRYQDKPRTTAKADSNELALVKLRYKEPTGQTSRLFEVPVTDQPSTFRQASEDLRFAASVAAFGMVLTDSTYKGTLELSTVARWASEASGRDTEGYRHEFVRLVGLADKLKGLETK